MGLVNRVVEKQAISNDATVGIYNFRRGADFVRAAEDMIAEDLRVNDEFYVAPVYNQPDRARPRDRHPQHRRRGRGMYGLGTRPISTLFKSLPVLQKALAPCL